MSQLQLQSQNNSINQQQKQQQMPDTIPWGYSELYSDSSYKPTRFGEQVSQQGSQLFPGAGAFAAPIPKPFGQQIHKKKKMDKVFQDKNQNVIQQTEETSVKIAKAKKQHNKAEQIQELMTKELLSYSKSYDQTITEAEELRERELNYETQAMGFHSREQFYKYEPPQIFSGDIIVGNIRH